MFHLSHELFGGEDQLMVDKPTGLFLKQGAVGVHVDCLLMFHCLITTLTEAGCVVKITCSNRLGDKNEGKQSCLT